MKGWLYILSIALIVSLAFIYYERNKSERYRLESVRHLFVIEHLENYTPNISKEIIKAYEEYDDNMEAPEYDERDNLGR